MPAAMSNDKVVLALDLGTTAFKAAAVRDDEIVGQVAVVPTKLEYGRGGAVTCPPERYRAWALDALRNAAGQARALGFRVRAIGISSQAQTFIPTDGRLQPVGDAIVWTDATATDEAAAAAEALPDFAHTSGFAQPSPQQFLPKVMRHAKTHGGAARYLLLNEWVIAQLTGTCYGDTVNQGMGGFYDITQLRWNEAALNLAGLRADQLAPAYPAAGRCAGLSRDVADILNAPSGIPVYSCGNDQSCAAIGCGLEQPGELFANFGTAMVVYTLYDRPTVPHSAEQIAGISPLPSRWFLLAVESEFGNVVEWFARILYPRSGVGKMLERALSRRPRRIPELAFDFPGGGTLDIRGLRLGSTREDLVLALMQTYANRFSVLMHGVLRADVKPSRIVAGGGVSRSRAWCEFLSRRCGVTVTAAPLEHPALIGIARIIRNNAQS